MGHVRSHRSDQPSLVLPEATHHTNGHARGTAVISLNHQLEWVAIGRGRVDDLEEFLTWWAGVVDDAGRTPHLCVRVAGDAPARYYVRAAMMAEDLGYGGLRVAVHAPE